MRVRCVGAVVRDEAGRLLVIRRGNPPSAGLWSVPGGRVEPGESSYDAVLREALEETGLAVDVGGLLGVVDIPADDGAGTVYEVEDYLCTVVGDPDPHAGDDATDARWVDATELAALPLVPGLVTALTGWGVLPG
jgi:ADP-ribose pyrophosphatase YjhB (NUDIX family)